MFLQKKKSNGAIKTKCAEDTEKILKHKDKKREQGGLKIGGGT